MSGDTEKGKKDNGGTGLFARVARHFYVPPVDEESKGPDAPHDHDHGHVHSPTTPPGRQATPARGAPPAAPLSLAPVAPVTVSPERLAELRAGILASIGLEGLKALTRVRAIYVTRLLQRIPDRNERLKAAIEGLELTGEVYLPAQIAQDAQNALRNLAGGRDVALRDFERQRQGLGAERQRIETKLKAEIAERERQIRVLQEALQGDQEKLALLDSAQAERDAQIAAEATAFQAIISEEEQMLTATIDAARSLDPAALPKGTRQ